MTPVVPLSNDSWSMSFAKYLELRFYGYQYTRRANAEPCGHSIHHDYHQYFSYNQMVASFRWVPLLKTSFSLCCCLKHTALVKIHQLCPSLLWVQLGIHSCTINTSAGLCAGLQRALWVASLSWLWWAVFQEWMVPVHGTERKCFPCLIPNAFKILVLQCGLVFLLRRYMNSVTAARSN